MPGPNRRERRLKQTASFDEITSLGLSGVTDGDLLVFDSASGLWQNAKDLTGDFSISGDLSLTELVASGAISADSITLTNDATVGGNLAVTGSSTLQGALNANGTLDVAGATTLDSTLAVAGALTGAGFSFSGDGSVGGDLTVTGALTADSISIDSLALSAGLDVTGNSIFRDDLSVLGSLSVSGPFAATALSSSGDINAAGDLIVAGNGSFDTLTFDTGIAAPAHAEGTLFYDNKAKSLAYYNDEAAVSLNIGLENWVKVRNVSGSTITNGQAVYVSGATGNRPNIFLARSDSAATAECIGLATHDIADNADGYVTTLGVVNDVDTSAFSVGDLLYLSPTTAGGFTTTEPSIPDFVVPLGVVLVSNANTGSIQMSLGPDVRLGVGVELGSAANNLLKWNGTYWAEDGLLGIGALADPNADRVLFWDDSAGALAWLTMGTNLTITGTTLDAAGGGGSSTLAGLDDTAISGTQATGEVLYWDGLDWADTGAIIIDPAGSVVMYYDGTAEFRTADSNATDFLSGADVKDYGGNWRQVGFLELTRVAVSSNRTVQTADWGKVLHNTSGGNTFTFDQNTAVPVFAMLTIINSGGAVTLAEGTGMTLTWFNGTGTSTGNLSLADGGVCTVYKRNDGSLFVWGSGLS